MTVMQLTNRPEGEAINATLRKQQNEIANMLNGLNVNLAFRPHLVDLETGRHGVRWLIYRILKQAEAEFPAKLKDEDLPVVQSWGLTTSEVCTAVRAHNGYDRYPDKSILHYLGTIMRNAGQVGSIEIESKENRPARLKGVRKLWYLIAD